MVILLKLLSHCHSMNTIYYVGYKLCQWVKYSLMSSLMMVCPVVSFVYHHGVQAVALLLPGHLLVHALDPWLTITQVGLKAPNPLHDHPALYHQAWNITWSSSSDTSFGTGTAWLGFLKFLKLYYFARVFFFLFFLLVLLLF